MTTEPKNELPGFHKGFRQCKQCEYTAPPELKKSERKHFDAHVFECTRCLWTPEAMPTVDKAREAWNARPAKAVQGDLLQDISNVRYQLEQSEFVYGLECFERIVAALTPESEGIAGKGEEQIQNRTERERDFFMIRYRAIQELLKDVPPKPYPKGKTGGKGAVRQVMTLIDWYQELSKQATLARPQEIDVEAIKREIYTAHIKRAGWTDEMIAEELIENPDWEWGYQYGGKECVDATIDHLAESGYLSAPAEALDLERQYDLNQELLNRKKELMAVIADLSNRHLNQHRVRDKHAAIIAEAQKGKE